MNYLESTIKQLEYYKMLGERAIAQIPDEKLFWQFNSDSNSVAIIVKHLSGNMLSRWTDFLTSDGEKEWRNRDAEFENHFRSRSDVLLAWEAGWNACLSSIRALNAADLDEIVYIRNQGHTVLEAVNRQLAHYTYHVGQIVFIAKMAASNWQSLSIPKGASQSYNDNKFAQSKHREHFSDEYLPKH